MTSCDRFPPETFRYPSGRLWNQTCASDKKKNNYRLVNSLTWSDVLSGIPQGTILGSLLFITPCIKNRSTLKRYKCYFWSRNVLKYDMKQNWFENSVYRSTGLTGLNDDNDDDDDDDDDYYYYYYCIRCKIAAFNIHTCISISSPIRTINGRMYYSLPIFITT